MKKEKDENVEPQNDGSAAIKEKKPGLMTRFVNSKFMGWLAKIGQKMASNRGFSSIMKAMMSLLSLILVGSIFNIIATVPCSFGWGGLTTASNYYKILIIPYNATFGFLSLWLAVLLGYFFGDALNKDPKHKTIKPIHTMMASGVCFLILCAQFQNGYLASGIDTAAKTFTSVISATYIDVSTDWLGAYGMIVAIMVGLTVPGIYKFCDHFHICIKMPSVVPQFLSDSFTALIPMLISCTLYLLLAWACSFTGYTFPALVIGVLSTPMSALTSPAGVIILCTIGMLLWFFGIHGTAVVGVILLTLAPSVFANVQTILASGGTPDYENAFSGLFLYFAMMAAGGSGNTLPLVCMCLGAKSKQLKSVGKAAIVPGLFDINEPVTFGTPLMYNPMFFFPFIFNVPLCELVCWLLYRVGFFQIPRYMIVTTLPIGCAEYLSSMAWQNLLIPVVCFVVAGLCYLPFFLVYDKQLAAKEALALRAEAPAANPTLSTETAGAATGSVPASKSEDKKSE
jgi:PTS system cellobiose-specific IIC component